MYLLNILTLKILDAVGRIEAWIEASILDNDDSPLVTTLGLALALLLGLWRRYAVPLFRFEGGDSEQTQARRTENCRQPGEGRESNEYCFDLHGRLVEIPRGAEKLMGSARETMIGSPFSRYLLDRDVPSVVNGFIRVLRGESVVDLRVRLRRADGVLVPVRMDLFPVIRSGEIEGVRGVLKMVHERPQGARGDAARPGPSVYVFRKGEMLFVNPRFEEASGYGRGELSSVDPMQIIHPADRSRVRRSNIEHLKEDSPSSCDFRIVTRDGRVRWVRARVRPVMYKGEKALLGNFVVMPAREEPAQRNGRRGDGGQASSHYGYSASA
jgi:PAS domain S-box-containing protein